MSTGLPVFDSTIQQTNEWLHAIEERLRPCGRQQAYAALRAVLHVLRDRLTIEALAGLSAQAPMLVRGLLFEGWRPGREPSDLRRPDDFIQAVAERLPPAHPREAAAVTRAVLGVITHFTDPGETRKLLHGLPEPLRALWPSETAA